MKVTAIRALVAKTRQVDPKDLGRDRFVYVDISSIDRDTKRIDAPQIVSAFEAPSRARKLIMTGDVLVSTVRPNLNAVALVGSEFSSEIASTGFCVLRPIESKLDSKYLYYFCQDQDFVDRLTRLSIGAGYPAVSDGNILDTEIPLPPLPEQQRIAGILSRADRLRRLRRYALELSDGYLQAVFLEMFGDQKRCKSVKLSDLLLENPKNGLYLPAEQYGHGTPIIRINNFYDGVLGRSEQFKRVKATATQFAEFSVSNGDVLINRVNSLEYLGKCALVRDLVETTLFESNIMRVRIDQSRMHPLFFVTYWSSRKAQAQILERARKAVNQASINQTDIKSIEIPLPDIDVQHRFVAIASRHHRLQTQQREALRQAEHLFQTLLHGAFRGEG